MRSRSAAVLNLHQALAGVGAVAVLGFTFGGGSGVAIIAAGGHGPILPQ